MQSISMEAPTLKLSDWLLSLASGIPGDEHHPPHLVPENARTHWTNRFSLWNAQFTTVSCRRLCLLAYSYYIPDNSPMDMTADKHIRFQGI